MIQSVPFVVGGTTGGHRSKQFSGELTQNVYMDIADANGRAGMHDFLGLKPFCACEGEDRGWHAMGDNLYKINGSSLYRILSDGSFTFLGSVNSSGRAIFADDGYNLLFVVGGTLYKWNGVVLTVINQTVINGLESVSYINTHFIISGSGGQFATSDPGTTNFGGLNVASEQTSPDALLRPYVFNQLVYMMGANTAIPWENTGTGNPPFSRRDSSLVNIGLAGKFAVTNTDNYMYWFSDDRLFYQGVGASARPVSTPSISHIVNCFNVVSDCVMSQFNIDGQIFVLAAFPTENKVLMYSETNNYWGTLASGTNEPTDRWYGNEVIFCYGKYLVSDYRNGNVYSLDKDTFTDNGDARLRIRTLPSFNSNLIRLPARQITVSGIRFNMQVGVGLATGQGINPVLMCQLSNDGGITWSEEYRVNIGIMGDYTLPADLDAFCTGYEVRCKIKCSDPVFLSMWDGVVFLSDAGF